MRVGWCRGEWFNITAGGTTVRGFAITDFTADGIQLNTAGGNTIEGNIIGLRTTGDGATADVIGGAIGWWKGENNGNDSLEVTMGLY